MSNEELVEHGLTVGDLREALMGVPDEWVVVLQEDGEGNGYRLAAGGDDNSLYAPESLWRGEVCRRTLTDEDRAAGWTDEDLGDPERDVPCFVIWPVN